MALNGSVNGKTNEHEVTSDNETGNSECLVGKAVLRARIQKAIAKFQKLDGIIEDMSIKKRHCKAFMIYANDGHKIATEL